MYLVIDLGGTEIKYALMREDATILEKSKIKTPIGADKTINDLLEVFDAVIASYQSQIKGIGISMPGIIDSDTGYAFTGGSIVYTSKLNLAKMLEEKYHIPVTVENDGKAAAIAEMWKGSLKGVQNAAVVILGTGVGGGLIIDGKLYKGNAFAAGEMSFILTNPEVGEYWGWAGGSAHLIRSVSRKLGVPLEEMNGYRVFEMAEAGQSEVLEMLDAYTKKMAYQLYNLQSLLDLEVFAIGGGISKQPLLMEYLQKNIDEFMDNHPFKAFMPLIPTPKITTCQFFNESNLIGALYHHLMQTGGIKNESTRD